MSRLQEISMVDMAVEMGTSILRIKVQNGQSEPANFRTVDH